MLLPITESWCIEDRLRFDPQKVFRYWLRKDCGQSLDLNSRSGEEAFNSFVFRLHEDLLGRYVLVSTYLYRSRRCSMRSLIGSLSLVFALTACAPLAKHDPVFGDAAKKAEQQQEYNTWWQSLTPEQRAREIEKQHERALSP